MWCLKCGDKEPGGGEKCKTCEYPIGTPENRLYLLQLMRMTGDLLCGNIDKEAYDRILTNTSLMLDEMHRGILAIERKLNFDKLPEGGQYVMSRPLNSFKEGIEIFSNAMDELRMYLVDPEEDHLRKGLKLVEKANNTMYYCFEVSQYALKEIKRFVPESEQPTEDLVREELAKTLGESQGKK
ncbi:MAG: hypothetical protein RDV48_09545 [Candidatus Eremiobacteraeota bacterium]|nr:hypothetical protein [Candidatus Eremiobacteraeota bacterium]